MISQLAMMHAEGAGAAPSRGLPSARLVKAPAEAITREQHLAMKPKIIPSVADAERAAGTVPR